MRTLLLLFFVVGSISTPTFSQNLVPNPSFEDTVSCPTGLDQINSLQYWFSARPSPDYFNMCSINGDVSIPNNYWGYQMPSSGSGYIGLVTYYGGFNTREFVGVELLSPLDSNTLYHISMNVVLGLESSIVKCASNNLGVFFSNTKYDGINDTLEVKNAASVFSNLIIIDTLNWITLNFSFLPDSNYKFLYIGNFFEDSLTSIIQYGPSCAAYYYIDDICVAQDSLTCPGYTFINEEVKVTGFTFDVFPNPSLDKFIIRFKSDLKKDHADIIIFNQETHIVESFRVSNTSEIEVNCKNWSAGIYLIKLGYKDQTYSKLFMKIKTE